MAIHLVFDVKKLGGIEPDARLIGCFFAQNIVGHIFSHHPSRVPNGLNGAAAGIGLLQFGAVANGVHIGGAGL